MAGHLLVHIRASETVLDRAARMVFVDDDPFVTPLAEAGRQPKIDRPTRRAIAVEQTDRERHVVSATRCSALCTGQQKRIFVRGEY